MQVVQELSMQKVKFMIIMDSLESGTVMALLHFKQHSLLQPLLSALSEEFYNKNKL